MSGITPGTLIHHQEVNAVLRADIEEGADVGVVQRGTVLASRSKRSLRAGSGEKCAGRILTATVRSRQVSRARYTPPIPPAPSGE